jgi:hypothetical protein
MKEIAPSKYMPIHNQSKKLKQVGTLHVAHRHGFRTALCAEFKWWSQMQQKLFVSADTVQHLAACTTVAEDVSGQDKTVVSSTIGGYIDGNCPEQLLQLTRARKANIKWSGRRLEQLVVQLHIKQMNCMSHAMLTSRFCWWQGWLPLAGKEQKREIASWLMFRHFGCAN